MWSPIVLLFIVGLAFASNNSPAWKTGEEYVYITEGRTVANLRGISNQQSGIIFKAKLRIQPQADGNLRAKIVDPQYDDIPVDLREWYSPIPEGKMRWKPMKLSGKPFEIIMENERIVGLTVSRTISVVEANMIKSIVSQYQINTSGVNLLTNRPHTLPQDGDEDAQFSAMEETITGNTETKYLISPMAAHIVQANSEEAQYLDDAKDGKVIEVLKHKNYANNVELPLYTFGFGGLQWGKPGSNQMGQLFSRDSTSRIVLTGTLESYVIRKTSTVNEIYVSPTLSEQKTGLVASMVNTTLKEINSHSHQIEEVPQPIRVGNIVYSYEKIFSDSNEVLPKPEYHWTPDQELNEDFENYEENLSHNNLIRPRRSLARDEQNQIHSYKQELSDLKEAPKSPLLPMTMGNEGLSIKSKMNIVQEVEKLAKEIGRIMQDSEKDHHEEILDLYSTLVSLVRVMNVNEIQEAAKKLFTNKHNGLDYANWVALRDAVPASGTGPALLVIKEWIETKKITNEEASQVVISMVNSVRQPTHQYFRTLFDLLKQPEVQSQWSLNNSMLLSYTDLIRRVYVNTPEVKQLFPVMSFKPFRTEEGEQFIKHVVISYLSEELKEAIQRSVTQRIHVLIRALGNTGSYLILPVFKPYLEGKQQVSQFQRVLMVLAMDKLVLSHPRTAQNVLFRLCQNRAEKREVRIVALHQLMRTVPTTEMLQTIAHLTSMDEDEYVKAATKAAIETAAKLEGPQFSELRKNVQPVKILLEKQVYGPRYGGNYMQSYLVEELKKVYKQKTLIVGSDDTAIPKGLHYSIRHFKAGMKSHLSEIQALTSSLNNLLQVGWEQTAKYQKQAKQQREHGGEQERNQFSSQNIAKMLNMKAMDEEQVEGFLLMVMGQYKNVYGFDNRTLENLAEVVREWEEELKKEKEVNFLKLTTREMAISFPTETGFPFLFTNDYPTLSKMQGKVSATSRPELSQNGEIQIPDEVQLKVDMGVTFSTKVQSRLSFVVPFIHQQYFAGYDRHFQMNLPAEVKVQIDVKNKNVEAAVELKPRKEYNLLHYLTRPFTSKVDINSLEPISVQPHTKVITQDDLQAAESVWGKESTGIALHVEMIHQRQFLNSLKLARILTQQNMMNAFLSLWDDDRVQFSLINVNYRPEESSTNRVLLHLSYEQKYKPQPDSVSSSEWILNENATPAQRQEDLIKKIAAGIRNVNVMSVDSEVEFDGQQKIRYILSGAIAASTVDPKSRIMFTYKRRSNGSPKPHEVHFVAKSYIPNPNSFDLTYILKNEPKADSEIKVKFGNSEESLSKIEAQLEYRRTEEREQYLKELPMYKQCKEEMKVGNKQLPACQNMTHSANLLDSVTMKLRHENVKPELLETIQSFFQALQVYAAPSVKIVDKDESVNENEVKMQALFHPDLRAVNVTVKTPKQETGFKNIEVSELAQQVFVVHPGFQVPTRIFSQLYARLHTYRQSCVVDKTHINTFSNSTYPADISKRWTVMVQYIGVNSEGHRETLWEQLRSQPEQYVVLVRENPETTNKKDIKIVVSTPKSNYKIVEIDMYPAQSQGSSETKARVTVNGEEVRVNDKESHDVQNFIQMYSLPSGEVVVTVEDAFQVVFDGTRAKVNSISNKLRKNTAGLCGVFTEIKLEDFLTPQACVAREPEDFIKSYEIEGQKGNQIRDLFQGKTNKCVDIIVPIYSEVIVPQDYRSKQQNMQSTRCSYFQTKYVEENGEICFTLNVQPMCSSQCQPKRRISKNLPVHCIQRDSKMAKLWKEQIDSGSSPDFSQQTQHKTVRVSVPESCSR